MRWINGWNVIWWDDAIDEKSPFPADISSLQVIVLVIASLVLVLAIWQPWWTHWQLGCLFSPVIYIAFYTWWRPKPWIRLLERFRAAMAWWVGLQWLKLTELGGTVFGDVLLQFALMAPYLYRNSMVKRYEDVDGVDLSMTFGNRGGCWCFGRHYWSGNDYRPEQQHQRLFSTGYSSWYVPSVIVWMQTMERLANLS